jgi:hypothetical protein
VVHPLKHKTARGAAYSPAATNLLLALCDTGE